MFKESLELGELSEREESMLYKQLQQRVMDRGGMKEKDFLSLFRSMIARLINDNVFTDDDRIAIYKRIAPTITKIYDKRIKGVL